MGRGKRRFLLILAPFVLLLGVFVATCPVINRPWAYDINANLPAGLVFCAASALISIGLVSTAIGGVRVTETRELRPLLGALAFVVIVVSSVSVTWAFCLEDRMVAKRFGIVIPDSLYRSGQISEWMLEPTIESNQITAVVDLAGYDPDNPIQRNEAETLARLGVDVHRFKLDGDGTGEIERYVQALKAIDVCRRDGKRVLVHCMAGSQRTGGVVATYRLLVLRDAPVSVMDELRRFGFKPKHDATLLEFLNTNMPTFAQRLYDEGVIERVPDPMPKLSGHVN